LLAGIDVFLLRGFSALLALVSGSDSLGRGSPIQDVGGEVPEIWPDRNQDKQGEEGSCAANETTVSIHHLELGRHHLLLGREDPALNLEELREQGI
jgi:hypothetical protein